MARIILADDGIRFDGRLAGTAPLGGAESAVVGRAFVIIWPFSRITDLPIPATFQQAALHAATAAASPAVTVGGTAALAGGVLTWRRRRNRLPRANGPLTASQRARRCLD